MEKLYEGFNIDMIALIVRQTMSVSNLHSSSSDYVRFFNDVLSPNLNLVDLQLNLSPDFIYDSDDSHNLTTRIYLYAALKTHLFKYRDSFDRHKFTEAHKSFIRLSDLGNMISQYAKPVSSLKFFETLKLILDDDELFDLILEEDDYVMIGMEHDSIPDIIIQYIETPTLIFGCDYKFLSNKPNDPLFVYNSDLIDNYELSILNSLMEMDKKVLLNFIEVSTTNIKGTEFVEEKVMLHILKIFSELPFEGFEIIHKALKNEIKFLIDARPEYNILNRQEADKLLLECDKINLPGYMSIYQDLSNLSLDNHPASKIQFYLDQYIKGRENGN